jgi:hypothetical protein
MGFFGFIKSIFGGIFDFGKQIVNFFKNIFVSIFKTKMQESIEAKAQQEQLAMSGSRRTFVQPVQYIPMPQTAQPMPNQFTRPVQNQAPAEDILKWNDGTSAPARPVYQRPVNPYDYNPTMNTAFQNPASQMHVPQNPTFVSDQMYGRVTQPAPQPVYQYNPNNELRWSDNSSGTPIKSSDDDIHKFCGFMKSTTRTETPKDDGVVCAFGPKSNYVGNGKV